MAIQVPPLAITGDVITAAWGNNVRNSILEIDPDARGAEEGQTLVVNEDGDGYEFRSGGGVALTWAAEMTGDPAFPHNGGSTADLTIAADETWGRSGADRNFASGIVQLRKLTINAGVKVSVRGDIDLIACDEIEFGDADSHLSGDGPSGASAGAFNANYVRGGTASSGSARAQAGCGGIMLFVIAREFSGANGKITANGGNGWRNTSNAASAVSRGGQGAFSRDFEGDQSPDSGADWPRWDGTARSVATNHDNIGPAYLAPWHLFMGTGGWTTVRAQPSGGAASSGTRGAGGSGCGGGGAGELTANGGIATRKPSPRTLAWLKIQGCNGGGGGGTFVGTTGTSNRAGGGGGGAALAFARTLTATPVLEANGGTGDPNSNGAAGFADLVEVP
jgi:hypothetical protein